MFAVCPSLNCLLGMQKKYLCKEFRGLKVQEKKGKERKLKEEIDEIWLRGEIHGLDLQDGEFLSYRCLSEEVREMTVR